MNADQDVNEDGKLGSYCVCHQEAEVIFMCLHVACRLRLYQVLVGVMIRHEHLCIAFVRFIVQMSLH